MDLNLSDIEVPNPISDDERRQAEFQATQQADQKAEENKPGLWEAFNIARDLDGINFLFDSQDLPDLKPDPEFRFTPESYKAITEGIPEEYHSVFKGAMNSGHAEQLRQQVLREVEMEQRLASLGFVTSTGIRIAAGLTDLEALGVTLATEGAAAPYIAGLKASRVGRAVASGLLASTSNMAVEAIAQLDNPTRGLTDILYAGATGLVLGAPVGFVMGDGRPVVEAADRVAREIDGGRGASVGAAMHSTRVDPQKSMDDFIAHVESLGDIEASTFLKDYRMDMASALKGDDNEVFNIMGNILFDDPTGTPRETASAWQNLELGTRVNRFYRDTEAHFGKWLDAQDRNWMQRQSASTRREFFEQVGRAIRGENIADPNVQAMARSISDQFAEILELAKRPMGKEGRDIPGVKGFAEIEENGNYLTRSWSIDQLDRLRDRHGDFALREMLSMAVLRGSDLIDPDVVAKLGQEAAEEAAKDQADKIAKALMNTLTKQRFSRGVNINRVLSADGRDALTAILKEETDLDDGAISSIAKLLADEKGDGVSARAKRRIRLDETYRDPRTGLSISDFLENDAEKLFLHYAKELTGRIALARQGITSRADFENLLTRAEERARATKGYKEYTFKRNTEIAEIAWKHLLGQSTEKDPSGLAATMGRIVRDYNFVRVMNQSGLASISELGNTVGQLGFKAVLTHVPEFKKMMSRARTGQLEDGVADELEKLFGGVGAGRLMNPVSNRLDEGAFGITKDSRLLQQVDQKLQYAKRMTSDISGLYAVNQTLQRITLKAIAQKFTDLAHRPTKANLQRMRDIGLPEPMLQRVLGQIKDHSVTAKGAFTGKKFKSFDIDNWTDQEAATAFRIAGQRLARRIIQEQDIGEINRHMTTTLGKILFQFRSFMIGSWAKQTLYALKTRDVEAFSSMALTSLLGGLVYIGQTHAQALLREDKEKFLLDRLEPTKVARAAFARGSYASLIPSAVDTVTGTMITGEPLFGFGRSTGLGSDLLSGIPAVDLVTKVGRAVGGPMQAMLNSDYQYSEQDAKAAYGLLLFQNALGVSNVANRLIQELPDRSN